MFCFELRADEGDPGLVEVLLEAGSSVAFVGDEGLPGAGGAVAGDHVEADAAFVCCGGGQRVGDGQAGGRGDEVEAETPEVPVVGRCVAVGGVSGQVGALLGLAAGSAFYGGGVDQPDAAAGMGSSGRDAR